MKNNTYSKISKRGETDSVVVEISIAVGFEEVRRGHESKERPQESESHYPWHIVYYQ